MIGDCFSPIMTTRPPSNMFFNTLFKFGLFLLIIVLGAKTAHGTDSAGSERVLRAATTRSDLFRRSVRIERRFDVNLAYIETENGWQPNEIFASQVRIRAPLPVFNLEDHEHHLTDVECVGTTLQMEFVSVLSAADAMHACKHEQHGGYIVTSHSSCNEEGERSVYRIADVALSEDRVTLTATVNQTTFKRAFPSVDIRFGYTTQGHLFRRHADFHKVRRQDTRSTATSSSKATSVVRSSALSSTITPAPVLVPTDTSDKVTSASFNLAFQTLNSSFSLPDFVGLIAPLPNVPVQVGCKNCTTTGSLLLTQGSFALNTSNIPLNPFNDDDKGKTMFSVLQGGFVELQANGIGAHIELQSSPSTSGSFSLKLFDVPVIGFAIPGIGKAGVSFNGTLTSSYNISSAVDVTYGFNLVVPDNSKIRIDLVHMNNSGITGFNSTSLTALPFTANVTDINAQLSVGFRPTIPVGFSFADEAVEAQVGAFMDLPNLSATISTRAQNVDVQCDAMNSTTPTPTTDSPFLPASAISSMISAMGPLLHIEPDVSLDVGAEANFHIPVLGNAPIANFQTSAMFFSKKLPLPTACLAPKEGFKAAAEVLSSATSSYIASVSAASAKAASSSASVAAGPGSAGVKQPPSTGSAPGLRTPQSRSWPLRWQAVALTMSVIIANMV